MAKERIKVRYEFMEFNTPATLVLNEPASLHFINVSPAVGQTIIINNTFILDRFIEQQAGTSINPAELKLDNNDNEQDETNYTIRFPAGDGLLKVIVKYFTKEN